MDNLNVYAVPYNSKIFAYSKSNFSVRSLVGDTDKNQSANIYKNATSTQDIRSTQNTLQKFFDKTSGVLALRDELTNIQEEITTLQEMKKLSEMGIKSNLSGIDNRKTSLEALLTSGEIKSDITHTYDSDTYDKAENSLRDIAKQSIYISSQIDALSTRLENLLMEINHKPLTGNEISEVVKKIKKSSELKTATGMLVSGGISTKKAAFLLGL